MRKRTVKGSSRKRKKKGKGETEKRRKRKLRLAEGKSKDHAFLGAVGKVSARRRPRM